MFKAFKKITIIIAAALVSLSLNLLPVSMASAATSSTNNFYFDSFRAVYLLYRDEDDTSRMIVNEMLDAVFPNYNQNHGITRVIPFTNQNGKNMTMVSDDTIYIDVTRNDKEEPVSKVEIGDGYFEVYIGDPSTYVTGEQTYGLSYEFENVITDFGEWQELYWDTNGNDWQQRFNSLAVRIYLDESIADSFTGKTACYVGYYGKTGENRCETTEVNDTIEAYGHKFTRAVEFSSTGKLSSRENLTFDLEFEPSTFKLAPKRFDFRFIIIFVVVMVAGIVLVVLMIKCLRDTAEKRKYYKDYFTKPEYTPPLDLTVAEMAANYIGKGGNGDARVATLLELAVQHKIEMVKSEKDGAFGKKKTVWTIRVKTDTLKKEQAAVLKILAGSSEALHNGQEIEIKSRTSNTSVSKLLTDFTESVNKALETKDLKEPEKKNDKKVRNFASILTTAASVVWIGLIFAAVFMFDNVPSYKVIAGAETPLLPAICIVVGLGTFVAALIVGVKTSKFYTHTMKGLEYSKYMEGLQLYIKMAEADRLKMLQSAKGADTTHKGVVKIYEKLLPYAAVFKLEKSWLEELGKYYEFDDVAAPTWYVGVGVFSAREFSSAMAAASSAASSSIAYSSTSGSSSGVSGFGGGGFSGGGGGGGGGGGW